ncbi:hypothetical protein [Actinomadura sp. DC4]|uniref:hypothetical protein n=1 Tax=Actinomadura sp. DC4 TaxID=3055069 RepID=UPI0025AF32B2|nr:hypothetical protein [Actinomadura sp. DC4]MDN3358816.1 hypothetical protein [Actinomadura sp. DC4]
MSDSTPGGPAPLRREPQVLGADEMIVYEAIATLRRPLGTGDLTATTGLDEDVVQAAVDRLTELEMVENGGDGVRIGQNDWDVRGAR